MTPADYSNKAARALDSAKLLLLAGDTSGACNRAYYAMFNAAHACLMKIDGVKPSDIRTHKGLLAVFKKNFLDTGIVESSIGRSLNQVESARNIADYIESKTSVSIANIAVERADIFLSTLIDMGFIDDIKITQSDIPVCSYCGQTCDGNCIGGMKP